MKPGERRAQMDRTEDGIFFDPAFTARLRSLGLLTVADARETTAGSLVAVSNRREVRRLADAEPVLYLKRRRPGLKSASPPGGVRRLLDRWARRRRSPPTSLPEWDHLFLVEDLGISVPRPVAMGVSVHDGPFWFLVTEELPGMDLSTFLRQAPDDPRREGVILEAGNLVDRLARGSFLFLDFVGKHLHVLPGPGAPAIGLLDTDRAVLGPVGVDGRTLMAADLLATIPDPALGAVEVRRFVESAFGAGARVPWPAVLVALRERRERRRLRRFLAADPSRCLARHWLGPDGSVWRTPPPFATAADAAARLHGCESWTDGERDYRVVWGGLRQIDLAFRAAEQVWRFDLSGVGLPVGRVRAPGEEGRAALVVDPLPAGGQSLAQLARTQPEDAGRRLGRLHRAGILSTGFVAVGEDTTAIDWRQVVRPEVIREPLLRRDRARTAAGLPAGARETFFAAYDAQRESFLETALEDLAAGRGD